jgi:O-antigen/teichoic acid export membrane protein
MAPRALVESDPRRKIGLYVGQLLGGELINKLLRFVALVLLARALSPSDFGVVNVGIAISGIALVASSMGLPDLGAREVAVAPERVGWLAGHVAVARTLVLGVVSVIGIALATFIWPGHTTLLLVAALMAIFMAVSSEWLARGLEQMSLAARAKVAGGCAVLAGSIAVAALAGTATAALGVFAIGELVATVFLWANLRRSTQVEFGLGGMRAMLRRAAPLALSSIAIYSYYANLDTIILAASQSNREAGLYSAAYRVFLVLNLVGVFAAYAMLPTLARLSDANGEADADRLVGSAIAGLASYGLVTLGIVELVGGDALAALFGPSFRAASGAFVLLAAGVAWYSVGYPAGYSLIARGENARFLRGAATASILCIGLDFALIPLIGMAGAGLATMLAFAAGAIVWLSSRGLLGQTAIPILLALSVTSGAGVGVAFLHRGTSLAGAGTLVVASVLFLTSGSGKMPRVWATVSRGRSAR